jgi:DnaK suppressor protein
MPRRGALRIAEFRQLLADARRRLMRTVEMTDEELAGLSTPEMESEEEAARHAVAQSLDRLEGQERHELDEIDAATARLEAGLFGRCEACRGSIGVVRLRAVPWARHCLSCQEREEQSSSSGKGEANVGIRKSYGKNKKNERPAAAAAAKREEAVRRAGRSPRRPARPPRP